MKNNTKKTFLITSVVFLICIVLVLIFSLSKCTSRNSADDTFNSVNNNISDNISVESELDEANSNIIEDELFYSYAPYYYNNTSTTSSNKTASSNKDVDVTNNESVEDSNDDVIYDDSADDTYNDSTDDTYDENDTTDENTTAPEVNNPFEGKKISVMGDSISTYTGWSDNKPITDESCTYRYGEAYYGPVGGDFHNTDLLVTDTWWHQAATELGAEILRVNSGNSTGLLYASYPANLEWQQYLQDMLAYKSRPYYMGTETDSPDIIALYIGSNDVARVTGNGLGSVDSIDFNTLIVENEDGTYTYATPTTVAEAYSILLHKLSVTYPDAEIYCFTVVPNSGGKLSTCNTRLVNTYPFNDMVRDVAEHYEAIVVDLFEAFALDPNGDGIAVQEDFEIFQSYFNGDPHPNASGFDVITKCFVDTVLANSKYR